MSAELLTPIKIIGETAIRAAKPTITTEDNFLYLKISLSMQIKKAPLSEK